MSNPFEVLGVPLDASQQDIHAAWRRLAKQHHPDTGGDVGEMVRLNEAFRLACEGVAIAEPVSFKNETSDNVPSDKPFAGDTTRRLRHDVSCFSFNVLPVESFPLLEIAAATLGTIIEADCPYLIEFTLENLSDVCSSSDWCRCEMVPEAGGTMVHLTIGGLATTVVPSVEYVRDHLIDCVNQLCQVNVSEQQP
jgi:hypothetical protein